MPPVPPTVLLGPQRLQPTLVEALDAFGIQGPIVAVTAGWEEREDEVESLEAHIRRPVRNLQLFHRAETVFLEDWRLAAAWRERRVRLREIQDLYRARLVHLVRAVRDLDRREGRQEFLAPERQAALETVRELDRRHGERLEEYHRSFRRGAKPEESRPLAAQRKEVMEILVGAAAVTLAGGNVAVLMNRLRLFGLEETLRGHAVFAWSAGAMVAAERIVIFQDDPPQGPGNPEVFGRGLGLCPEVLPLPHASKRLRLEDPGRVARFARRFGDRTCLVLDPGSGIGWDGRTWSRAAGGMRRLTVRGTVEEMDLPALAGGLR